VEASSRLRPTWFRKSRLLVHASQSTLVIRMASRALGNVEVAIVCKNQDELGDSKNETFWSGCDRLRLKESSGKPYMQCNIQSKRKESLTPWSTYAIPLVGVSSADGNCITASRSPHISLLRQDETVMRAYSECRVACEACRSHCSLEQTCDAVFTSNASIVHRDESTHCCKLQQLGARQRYLAEHHDPLRLLRATNLPIQ
jgi:hypothetical protein